MRKENLVRTKIISVFDLSNLTSKLTIGNAYRYTHIVDDRKSVTFQGILLQKYEEYLVFAISNHSEFARYATFVEENVAGCSIIRLPARFWKEDDTLEEMTVN